MTVHRHHILMHGKTSQIHHDGRGIFEGLPDPFTATRYHSLIVDRATIGDEFEVSAWTDQDEVMGLRWAGGDPGAAPMDGVQFHPESFSDRGRAGPAGQLPRPPAPGQRHLNSGGRLHGSSRAFSFPVAAGPAVGPSRGRRRPGPRRPARDGRARPRRRLRDGARPHRAGARAHARRGVLPRQSGDRPLPAVIYIHGGGFRGGRKEAGRRLITALAEGGYFSVSLNVPAVRPGAVSRRGARRR